MLYVYFFRQYCLPPITTLPGLLCARTARAFKNLGQNRTKILNKNRTNKFLGTFLQKLFIFLVFFAKVPEMPLNNLHLSKKYSIFVRF